MARAKATKPADETATVPTTTEQPSDTPSSNFDFGAYANNIQPAKSLPYAFIRTPKEEGSPYGIFITQDNAEAIEFTPDDRWQAFTGKFGTKNREEKSGYICPNPRMVIVRSSSIKVFSKVVQPGKDDSWKYVGDAYTTTGQITPLGEAAAEDTQSFQRRTYYLVYFIGEENQPLHALPIRLMTKNAFGGNFGGEVREFHAEINRVFFKAARLHNPQFKLGELDGETLALTVLDYSIGLRMSDKGSLVCYVETRQAPALNPDHIGLIKQVTRYGGQVTLTGVDWTSLFIHKDSELGQLLTQTYRDYADFGQELESSTGSEEPESLEEGESLKPVSFAGTIEAPPFGRYDADGNGIFTAGFYVSCPSGKRYYCETFGDEAELLCRDHSGWYEVKGVIGHGTLSAEPTVLIESIEPTAPPDMQ